jgi:hypothetical protein
LSSLQSQLDGSVTTANAILKAGWVIPKILGIDVSDVEIDFVPGLMKLGLSVSAASWESAARVIPELKKGLLVAKRSDIPESTTLIQ